MMNFWAEIRNDFFNADVDQREGDVLATVSIDAWRTPDDNEEGTVIASVLLSKHGDVLVNYSDTVAKTDPMAQEAIAEAKTQLRAYFQEINAMKSPEQSPDEAKRVYCLCEEHEDGTGIREFNILAVSNDKEYLQKHMQQIIDNDRYGFIKDNGVEYDEEDNFRTNYDCGFVAYYIESNQVLSREDLKRSLGGEKKSSLDERINDASMRAAESPISAKELGGKEDR